MDVNKYDGKLAITHYKLIKSFADKVSLIECSLATGRTHQIRVHMGSIGHPIIADKLYGVSHKTKYNILSQNAGILCNKFPGQALIAKKIGFIHPRTEEYLEFEIDYEKSIQELIESLMKL
jgi:23S rRNA pseudouridine1911/1915/1917 synthase